MTIEPHLWFDDLAAGVEWYRSVLGFSVTASHPEDSPTWFKMEREGAAIMLAITPPPSQAVGGQQFLSSVAHRLKGEGAPMSLYLHVEDASAEHDRAVAGGGVVIEALWDAWWGGRQFTVEDPAGSWWTVFEPTD
ncbi:MAG: VOC family protein [Actinomycetia bacterium]|nr:VOC family protein [Actinomycetes bacterium]